MTFKDAGLSGGDLVYIESDLRSAYWPSGTIIKIRDVRGCPRGPDMSNGSMCKFRLATEEEVKAAKRIVL